MTEVTNEAKIEKTAPAAPVAKVTAPVEIGAAPHAIVDGGLDELPEGAVVVGPSSTTYNVSDMAAVEQPTPQAAFADDHVGQGGSYVVGDDGVRRPAYEAFGISGNKPGETVTKYRRIK